MSCDHTYGVQFCGYDNLTFKHPDYPKLDPTECCKPGCFPPDKIGDTQFYICNGEVTDKIFRRLHCGQQPIPEYRPSFEVCRQQVDKNTVTHPQINMIDPCSDPQNTFTPCKGDGLGYLERILVDSELKCMNQYHSRVHETSAFKPTKIPNSGEHYLHGNVNDYNPGPHAVCGRMSINKCVKYPDVTEQCGPYGLLQIGEKEKPIQHRITAEKDGAHMFLPIGPTRCDELNRCEMTWDNNTKRHFKDSIPNYINTNNNNYQPQAFEGHPVPCPPVCKYDYTCIVP